MSLHKDTGTDDYFAGQPSSLIGRLAMRVGGNQRRRLYEMFLEEGQAREPDRVLDVGVTSEDRYETNNFLEEHYPYKASITAAGLAESSYLPARFPGLRYVQIVPQQPLPFADRAFDLVHASAVIEHVGSRARQQQFLQELWRVCRGTLFVTTPNRWFPIEVHTVIPLLHWLPPAAFRSCLRRTRLAAWADETQLNLLSGSDLLGLARNAGLEHVRLRKARLSGFASNLALIAQRAGR